MPASSGTEIFVPMAEPMSHDDYVQSCRKRAAEIAADIVAGSMSVLEGCQLLDRMASSVEVADDDPDFRTFNLIQSETDALPIGAVRAEWDAKALAEIDSAIKAAIIWAEPLALPSCRSVVARFGLSQSGSTSATTQL